MTTERRFTPLAQTRVEKRGEDGPAIITGYAAVFYREDDPGTEYSFKGFWDEFTERIQPTAFDRALREKDDTRALFNHSPDHLLGRTTSGTLKLSVDTVGLRYEIEPPDNTIGNDVLASIKRGDLSGSSFAFSIDEQVFREVTDPATEKTQVIREIVSVRLYDVGPVVFPAYESTTTGVRAASDLAEVRSAYEIWKIGQRAGARLADHYAEVLERDIAAHAVDVPTPLSLDQVRVRAMEVQMEIDGVVLNLYGRDDTVDENVDELVVVVGDTNSRLGRKFKGSLNPRPK